MIPLDDLPELQVGYGFGLVDKENIPKPAYLKDIKLITSANKHRFIVPGGVKQLTKEEFEAFTNQVKKLKHFSQFIYFALNFRCNSEKDNFLYYHLLMVRCIHLINSKGHIN